MKNLFEKLLAARLKKLRELKKVRQEDLARILKVSQKTISSWEVGRVEPAIEFLKEIANFFNTSIDYLVGLDSETKGLLKEYYSNNIKYKTEKEIQEEEEIYLNDLKKNNPVEFIEYKKNKAAKQAAKEVGLDIQNEENLYEEYLEQKEMEENIELSNKIIEEIFNIEPPITNESNIIISKEKGKIILTSKNIKK